MNNKRSHRGSGDAQADANLLDQLAQIARGLGETFAPFCEVVVHDLTDPAKAILAIHNNLSGRQIGEPATELGLARIADRDHPQVIANYPNHFADGRRVKSTSIGVKGADGSYIAALCLNVDLTLFQGLQSVIGQFTQLDPEAVVQDRLSPVSAKEICARIDSFAARLATSPRALKTKDRRLLLRELKAAGCLQLRNSIDIIAAYLGISRTTVYADTR